MRQQRGWVIQSQGEKVGSELMRRGAEEGAPDCPMLPARLFRSILKQLLS